MFDSPVESSAFEQRRVARALEVAADTFLALVARTEVEGAWAEESCLPRMTIGDLVAHVNTSTAWVAAALDCPIDGSLPALLLGSFYETVGMAGPVDLDEPAHVTVQTMARRGAQRGYATNLAYLRSLAAQLPERLAAGLPDQVDLRPMATASMPTVDFLKIRTVELVVHTDDLAYSLGLETALPVSAARVTTETLIESARHAVGDVQLIRSLARRDRAGATPFPVL